MYGIEIREHLDRTFRKLARKDAKRMEAITKKIAEIAEDPHAYKPLHFPLAGKRSVRVGSFVLIFSIDKERETVVLEDYEHHDRVYRA